MKLIKTNIIPEGRFSPKTLNNKPMFKSCKNNQIMSVSGGHLLLYSSLVFATMLISAPLHMAQRGLKALNDNVSHHMMPQSTKREQ